MSVNIYSNGTLTKVAGNVAIDENLSTESSNAVQNKTVTGAISEINENLSANSYGESAGGVNVFDLQNATITDDGWNLNIDFYFEAGKTYFVKVFDYVATYPLFLSGVGMISNTGYQIFTPTERKIFGIGNNDVSLVSLKDTIKTLKIMVAESSTVIDTYEPYIASNLQLTESTNTINNDLSANSYGESAGGKNLFGVSWEQGSIDESTGKDADSSVIARTPYIEIESTGTYTLAVVTLNSDTFNAFGCCMYDSDKTFLGVVTATMITRTATSRIGNISITNSNCKYIRFKDSYSSLCSSDFTNIISVQLELGTTATNYEPYIESNYQLTSDVSEINSSLSTKVTGYKQVTINGKSSFDFSNLENERVYFVKAIGFHYSGSGSFIYETAVMKLNSGITSSNTTNFEVNGFTLTAANSSSYNEIIVI